MTTRTKIGLGLMALAVTQVVLDRLLSINLSFGQNAVALMTLVFLLGLGLVMYSWYRYSTNEVR